jgi:hypothetical protein
LKDVRPDEQNKMGTRGSHNNEGNFSLVAHDFTEPSTYKEAVKHKEWQQAMVEEYQAVIDNNTWKLVDCPTGVKPIGCKWVYRIKYNQHGEIDKYKARLVAKGFAQQEGIDYEETFAPTAKWNTIRLTLALAAQKGWKVHQMDVKSAFLNGDLQEDVYMQQPPGFEIAGQEHKVCKLIKALYGLKQAPRAWYTKMDEYLRKVGFHRSESDDTLYIHQQGSYLVILIMFVDDLLITGNNDAHIAQVKKELHAGFKMTDLGLLHYYLGVEVFQRPHHIFISQSKYAAEILQRFGMQDCKPSLTPMEQNLKLSKFEGGELVDNTIYRQLIGSLIYLTNTRPDLSYAVSILSRFMQQPRDNHWNAAKRVLRYLQGTKDFGLLYQKTKNFVLGGFSDADFARSIDDRASTSGYLMNMGSTTVSWNCKKQATVATSTAEAEYISAWEATCEIVWLRRILQDLGISQAEATSLFIDSQSAIKLAKNPVFHSKTKHVDTKYHHIRSLIAKDVIKPIYCPSEDQISDIFTKPLGRIKFTKFRDELGICCNVSLDHRGEC